MPMTHDIPHSHYTEPFALRNALEAIDGRPYGAYRNIQGNHPCGSFQLIIDRVQRDPFAPPTLVRIRVPLSVSGFSHDLYCNTSRRIGFCDFLTRAVAGGLRGRGGRATGSGNSGRFEIAQPGQEIVERSSIQLLGGCIEARLYLGLPAQGRRILAEAACGLLLKDIPAIVERSLLAVSTDALRILAHVNANEDQDVMRHQLRSRGLVAFVAEGSVLPRRSGEDDRCCDDADVVPFCSPESCRVALETRHRGTVTGMGVRSGVTVITGGGYHGKSTFLQALERGVYNHVPGDGREGIVTDASAVKIRAEEGRSIRAADLRPFLRNLPQGVSPRNFTTGNASGSTSQAAAVVESVEAGATALLLDEDTSASNFLGRDDRVRRLIPDAEEPILPLVGSVGRLFSELGVSTILVAGASGAFFGGADKIFRCRSYVLEDVTDDARRAAAFSAAKDDPAERPAELPSPDADPRKFSTLGLSREDHRIRVQGRTLLVGGERIQLDGLEQLVRDEGNAAHSLALVLLLCERLIEGPTSTGTLLARAEEIVDLYGLDRITTTTKSGKLVRPRQIEIAGAINRLRRLDVVSAVSSE